MNFEYVSKFEIDILNNYYILLLLNILQLKKLGVLSDLIFLQGVVKYFDEGLMIRLIKKFSG